jgi:hypothetical protein
MTGAIAQISHKRGDTFSYGASDVSLPAGESWTASAHVRDPLAPDSSPPLTSLACALTPPVAPATNWDLSLYAPATDTAKWPVSPNYAVPKTLVCDVQFTCQSNPSIVVSSATLQILVFRDVTR